MKEYVLREDVLRCVEEAGHDNELDLGYPDHNEAFQEIIKDIPAADVVPWEWLELYADYFWAGVSMPEFVREAKMFYESSNKAMQGGVIDG